MTRVTVTGECPECERRVTIITDLPEGIGRPEGSSPVTFDLRCEECGVDFTVEEAT